MSRWLLLLLLLVPVELLADPIQSVDLAQLSPASAAFTRVYGSDGDGANGVPVAGGLDVDGDGFADSAFAAMTASPLGRFRAGQLYLVFGSGGFGETLDTSSVDARILRVLGAGVMENAGSELWMDDVTGEGFADLLIARQNFRPDAGRPGAGALTILIGTPALRAHAETLLDVDLANPGAVALLLTTFVGPGATDRLGIWMRTGDVTGDGIADILVGADQEDRAGENDSGAVYVIRGGPHLIGAGTIDLAQFGSTALAGHIARITPPAGAGEYHFGATCQIADLDNVPGAEVLAAAALNRAGAGLAAEGAPGGSAHASAGSPDGTLYIVWSESFAADPWPAGYAFQVDQAPGDHTIIDGGALNKEFGEEILGGLDYDGDGRKDLFVGDITGDLTLAQSRPNGGAGHVFWDASTLRGEVFGLDAPPAGIEVSSILGAAAGHIAGDTAAHGEFDSDPFDDLVFSAPHASPFGRLHAGTVYVLHGGPTRWPAWIDLSPANFPDSSEVRVTELHGANGGFGTDAGDTLSYSAAAGDFDGDGRIDLVTNEMQGNTPTVIDAGNLIVVSGALVASPLHVPTFGPLGLLALGAALGAVAFALRSAEGSG